MSAAFEFLTTRAPVLTFGFGSLWNYNPLNTDEWGDSWNNESFSWFSTSAVTEERLERAAKLAAEEGEDETMAMLNVGARILDAIEVGCSIKSGPKSHEQTERELLICLCPLQRPYGVKTCGIPLRAKYDFHTLSFSYAYINPIPKSSPIAASVPPPTSSPTNPPIVGEICAARETEIYLPSRRYGKHFRAGTVRVKLRQGDGEWSWNEEVSRSLVFHRVARAPTHEAPSLLLLC